MTLRDIPLRQVPVVNPETALSDVIEQMEADPLQTVILTDGAQYMGVFNRDALAANLIPPGADRALLTIGPYVHPARVIGRPDMTTEQALALMERRNLAVIPVVDRNRYVGVVTRADLEPVR